MDIQKRPAGLRSSKKPSKSRHLETISAIHPDTPIPSIEPNDGDSNPSEWEDPDEFQSTQGSPPSYYDQGVLIGFWNQGPVANGRRYPVYACPTDREFYVEYRGRLEPVRLLDFDELEKFEDFTEDLINEEEDEEKKAIEKELWMYISLLWKERNDQMNLKAAATKCG